MSRQYNQQNPDGSWSLVTQNDDGTYTVVPIPTSGYKAANIPGGSVGADSGTSFDPAAADAASNAADQAARNAYNKGMLELGNERLALDKATEAWKETFERNIALGSIDGQDTLAKGQLMGSLNGQPTEQAQNDRNTTALGYLSLLSKLTGPANAFEYAKTLTGTPGGIADIVRAAGGAYRMPSTGGGNGAAQVPLTIDSLISDVNRYSPTAGGGTSTTPSGTTPVAGGAPGVYTTVNGPKTLAQMHAELQTAQYGGPWDDASVLAAYGRTSKGAVTPMTTTVPGADGASGQPSTGKSTLTADQLSHPNFSHAGPPTAWQPSASQPNPPTSPPPTLPAGLSRYTPSTAGQVPSNGAGATTGSASSSSSYVPSTGPLPSPNSISPQNWNNMTPSQQALLIGDYKDQGWMPDDVLAMFKNSLKAYGGPSSGSVGF